ncbi:MAG: lipase [Pseudorhodoplanes sp.]|uniref:lipase n=1 Tax=Pseudorhodoplanes sp. TaxID=1934341 RepID=UPI003D13E222
MSDPSVKKRCVFFLGGYEPIPPERQRERYIRELARTERVWSVKAQVEPLELDPGRMIGTWRLTASGPNWSTQAAYNSLLWHDIVLADFARPGWRRVPLAVAAFADFIRTGTAFRYFSVNWRYGLFFAYPVTLLLAFAALSLYAASFLPGLVPGLGLLLWLLVPLAALAVFVLLMLWPGRFLLFDYMMDDWIFGNELVHRSRPDFDRRLEGFAQTLADVMRRGDHDEVVFAAHSLGCALKVAVVDRALQLVPEFGKNGERLSLLSTGSSLLKIAFHPKAGWLREAIARVSANPAVFWIEYQTMADPISFYKVDPLAALNLPATGSPIIRRVHIRDMLEPATYRRFKANFFRLHRQLVMGNEKRYFYDYYMICCGPLRLETRVFQPETVVPRFAPDGALVEPPGERASAEEERPVP